TRLPSGQHGLDGLVDGGGLGETDRLGRGQDGDRVVQEGTAGLAEVVGVVEVVVDRRGVLFLELTTHDFASPAPILTLHREPGNAACRGLTSAPRPERAPRWRP